ncbi:MULTISPECIES: thioredoxin [Peribacillus]|uniref:Thioredoxin n=1 Tax=Peribacillus butanolivorans TaxID=421767 RepID=A0AAX0S831_9BACI|nr:MULTISPECIES: thioredoxin [Peribacillus]AXN40780.1 thioredoxin [Peribacillus butanolivorans]MBK5459119.1 thioredoxin [Peribacillus sp. TH27]MBK5502481.1 thioredoxin [Peribacillus sp. TH14]PEJ37177.1 thioredoxin [Peribacillus butanolivorans]WMX57600.1 thioredoxin [Peribacillus sp. R9-11]
MSIMHVTDQTFASEIKEGLVLVDFWAPWCGPCKMIAPVLNDIDVEMGDQVKIVKLNVDENGDTTRKYGVMGIPALILFKDGEIVDQVVGYQPKEALTELIAKHA